MSGPKPDWEPLETAGEIRVPVCRPLLPRAEAITPYLRRIEDARFYSNHGPLVKELEARLCALYGADARCAVTAGSGAMALIGAILGHAGRGAGRRCLTPAFGFPASASAAQLCGYALHFADIDPAAWSLDPEALAARGDLDDVGLALVVAPYGSAIDLTAWRRFEETSGVPVVIDAAASFDTLAPPDCGFPPTCVSLHATKSVGVGEGGFALIEDAEHAEDCRAALNHGFQGTRQCERVSTNGKMSEYHAAVGHAALDELDDALADWDRAAAHYRRAADAAGLATPLRLSPRVARSYALAEFPDRSRREDARRRLAEQGVQTRRWYGPGLHFERAFADAARDPLDHTEALAGRLLGLPMARDLGEDQAGLVVDTLAALERG